MAIILYIRMTKLKKRDYNNRMTISFLDYLGNIL
ncbi:hypothetical protein HMPREF9455_03802 [Dysgonomonas gadei ATCC BAA-286]|uniref:Uncharacterized protein n=1 Tax=Dysgonomonas gadei ATCC BAA-286 TaxID=742766 RepID=F5J385_9BACT|nr:hypothetical protein HMPREF9455_03802 [Dysgonomonas gadei ATCC BAA-286]